MKVLVVVSLLTFAGVGRSSDLGGIVPDDAAPLSPWGPARAWTTSIACGVAKPWADAAVRTDWARVATSRHRLAAAVIVARTDAGTVDVSRVDVGMDLRVRTVGLRVHAQQTTTDVTGFVPSSVRGLAVGARTGLGLGAVGIRLLRMDDARGRWRRQVEWVANHGAVRWTMARTDRRFEPTAAWTGAVGLAVHPALAFVVGVSPQNTVWSASVRRSSWILRVGRVVQGPREGATALALEWTP